MNPKAHHRYNKRPSLDLEPVQTSSHLHAKSPSVTYNFEFLESRVLFSAQRPVTVTEILLCFSYTLQNNGGNVSSTKSLLPPTQFINDLSFVSL